MLRMLRMLRTPRMLVPAVPAVLAAAIEATCIGLYPVYAALVDGRRIVDTDRFVVHTEDGSKASTEGGCWLVGEV